MVVSRPVYLTINCTVFFLNIKTFANGLEENIKVVNGNIRRIFKPHFAVGYTKELTVIMFNS